MTVDYTNAQNQYDLSRAMFAQNLKPVQGAGPLDTLARVLAANFNSKNMRGAQHGMKLAETNQLNAQKLDMARALSALHENPQYQPSPDELMPGEQEIPGLEMQGTGNNRQAMVESLMTAQTPWANKLGMQAMLAEPTSPKAPKVEDFPTGRADKDGNPYFQKRQWVNGNWVDAGAPFVKKGVNFSAHVSNIPKAGPGERYIRHPDTQEIIGVEAKPTAGESTAINYAGRMVQDMKDLDAVIEQGFDPAQITEHTADKLGTLGNYMKSPEGQRYRASQEDWVRAKLRKESGAVIADEEMDREIRVYFPQPGDSEAVQFQKKLLRIQATNGMIQEAGPGFEGSPLPMPENPYSKKAVEVQTQEQFDALPSGALFIEDGVTYRKP